VEVFDPASTRESPNSSYIVAPPIYRTDLIENTASHFFHCRMLRFYCLRTRVFAEPFPSNECVCCLHGSFLEEICRIMFRCMAMVRHIFLRVKETVLCKKESCPHFCSSTVPCSFSFMKQCNVIFVRIALRERAMA
jgi:hypothetical protein